MRKISIDVGQQVAHDSRHTRTHVFGGEAGEVPGWRGVEKNMVLYREVVCCFRKITV